MTHENRHLNVKYHSVRWNREQKLVDHRKVSTQDNISDIGTKMIKDVSQFTRFARQLCHDCSEFDAA